MKNLHSAIIALIFLLGICSSINSQSAEEFRNRRKDVVNKMEPQSILLLRTTDLSARFDDGRRGGNFYYLTGINEPNCTLVLFSNDFQIQSAFLTGAKEVLFISPVNSNRMNWDAQTIGVEGARSKYGLEDARPNSEASEFTDDYWHITLNRFTWRRRDLPQSMRPCRMTNSL